MGQSTIYNRGRKNQPLLAGNSSQLEPFLMIPNSVDLATISSKALHVFACLVKDRAKSNTVWIGHRLIAKKTGLNRETVGAALKELSKLGHIVIMGDGKHRSSYTLTSNRFKEVEPAIVSAPRERVGFDGVVSDGHLAVPCGQSSEPIMRSEAEQAARKERRAAKKRAA